METREVLKSTIYSVTPRGSIKTSKPSTVEMTIGHRFANRVDELNQDTKEGVEIETGLIRLELVAVYEDGKAEEKEIIDLKFEGIGETLEVAMNEEKATMPFEDYAEQQKELEEIEKDGE